MTALPVREIATFAAGCFWNVEEAFRHLPGVVATRVGYTGGRMPAPTYEDVCTDETGHAEAVEVTYDPSRVTYEQLLKTFWEMHDPTQVNRQGPDVGTQYRSAIFTHSPEQERAAQKSKEDIAQSGAHGAPIVTEVVPAEEFYEAEEYHQRYLEKQGRSGGDA